MTGKSHHSMCTGEGAAAARPHVATPFEALMSGHILRDGELIQLMLRPSRWFILLSSLKLIGVVLLLLIIFFIFRQPLQIPWRQYLELGVVIIIGRLMWGVLEWMGRIYILTDLRIIRLSGVFSVEIFDCPLRRVARTLLDVTFKERLCRVGTIVIIPQEETVPLGFWNMVPRPRRVHEQVQAAISRAKQGGG